MGRIILVYGSIAGVIVISGWALAMTIGADGGSGGMIAGYLSMLVAFSMIFAGVKRYRDTAQGGVIRFWPALGLGLAIACVASIFYLVSWEVYMAATDYRFIGEYIAQTLEAEKAKGTAPAEIAKMAAEMAEFGKSYANPLFRMAVTFSEIAPVGLLVALVSAALLRNSRFMPAVAAR